MKKRNNNAIKTLKKWYYNQFISLKKCKRNKRDFLRGYNYMRERIEPDAIICLGDPFDEMDGNLVVVDYQKSRKVVR